MGTELTALETKIQYFREKQKEMLELDRALQTKKQEYLAEMKAAFGIADGEPANVLEIVEAIKRVKDMA